MRFSPEYEAELERIALANGGSVRANPVRIPGETSVEIETRMAWSEKKFQAEVVKLAKENGWKTYHTWLSIRSEKGFPDLVLVRGMELIFMELKKQKGKESAAQKEWRQSLRTAGRRCFLLRPSDWEFIEETLAPYSTQKDKTQ